MTMRVPVARPMLAECWVRLNRRFSDEFSQPSSASVVTRHNLSHAQRWQLLRRGRDTFARGRERDSGAVRAEAAMWAAIDDEGEYVTSVAVTDCDGQEILMTRPSTQRCDSSMLFEQGMGFKHSGLETFPISR